MQLFAISDLHLGYAINRQALQALPPQPDDWLILAGDMGDSPAQLAFALQELSPKFAQLLWVPGNHELWSAAEDPLRGVQRYEALVAICRELGALTPEDPFVEWKGEGGPCILAPLFTLYDYSFRPPEVPLEGAVAWAAETGVLCADERLLSPDPFPTREAWCKARCALSESRLAAAQGPMVLIDHFPLRSDLVYLRRIPRFSIWCGTQRTADWHLRFRAKVVVSGHLHVRTTRWIDGVRFEEVSLGYPRQWNQERPLASYLRRILPGPAEQHHATEATFHGL